MKGSKEAAKTERSASRVQGAITPTKRKKTKVVEVKLTKTRSKKAAGKSAAKGSGKAAAKAEASPARSKAQAKAATAASSRKSAASAKAPAAERSASLAELELPKAKRPAKAVAQAPAPAVAESQQPSLPPSPTMEVLKPFRDAAKRTRKILREKERARSARQSFLAKGPKKGKRYTLDLRVHTPGSVGFFSTGGVDPAPALVRLARVKGLHMVGLTDWYNASYVDAVKATAADAGVVILPGLDLLCRIRDCDEITIVALFPEHYSGADLFRVLGELRVPEWAHGRRDYCVNLDFSRVVEIIERNDGVLIPSRVDKTPFRHLAIPTLVEEFGIHAFDLIHPDNPEFFREKWPEGEFTFFGFSNANALGQVGSRTSKVKLATLGFDGLKDLVARRC